MSSFPLSLLSILGYNRRWKVVADPKQHLPEGIAISEAISQSDKERVRRYIHKANLYHITAIVAVCAALFVFISFYMKFIDGHPGVFLQKPIMLLYMLAPFIPAMALMLMAKSARQRANKIIYDHQNLRKRSDLYAKDQLENK